MRRKGRGVNPPPTAKITPEDVLKIRSIWIPYIMSVRKISMLLKLPYKSCETAISTKHWINVPWEKRRAR